MQRIKRVLILFTVAALCLLAVSCGSPSAEPEEYTAAEEGGEMRDFTGETVSGEKFTLSDQKGKVILLNFWATWCGPCVGELPAFPRLVEKYGDDLCLVTVNCGEDKETVESFLSENGYAFTALLDTDYAISDIYPTDGIPYTLIFDRDGKISHIQLGAGDADEMFDMYCEAIDPLI